MLLWLMEGILRIKDTLNVENTFKLNPQPLILNMSWHIVDDGNWEPVDVLCL